MWEVMGNRPELTCDSGTQSKPPLQPGSASSQAYLIPSRACCWAKLFHADVSYVIRFLRGDAIFHFVDIKSSACCFRILLGQVPPCPVRLPRLLRGWHPAEPPAKGKAGQEGGDESHGLVQSLPRDVFLSVYQRQASPQGLQVQTQNRYNTPGWCLSPWEGTSDAGSGQEDQHVHEDQYTQTVPPMW